MARALSISIRRSLVGERWYLSPGAANGLTLSSLQIKRNGVLCSAACAQLLGLSTKISRVKKLREARAINQTRAGRIAFSGQRRQRRAATFGNRIELAKWLS